MCGTELPRDPAPGVRKVVTIVFCDMAGSTALADGSDPEVVRVALDRYYARMRQIVERHDGTVEKFIGDAVMAVFGVPRLHEDDALRAVRAASEMREALVELDIPARIGVNTGEVITQTGDSLIAGDVVNVAARLEQVAAPGEVLMGAATHRLVRAAVVAEAAEPLILKGKADAIAAYRLAELRPEAALPEAPGVGRGGRAAMVARQTELGRLRGAFDQARHDPSCQLFTILGHAGVGKSRLVAEFVARLDDVRVVRGRCLSYGEGITYWPIVEMLAQVPEAAEVGLDPVAVRAIASLRSDSGSSTEEIAWTVRKLFERLAAERPLVVVFDDIHWAEPTLLDLTEQVADLSRDAPILIVCVARPEFLDRRSGWAGGKLNATTVLLEPLTADETGELIERLLAGVEMSEGLRQAIASAAEGNPLFVEEMLMLAQESGGEAVAVPPTIQALLAARLDQLEEAERAVLECAAVEGRVFHRGALTTLLPDESRLLARLDSLVRKELVRPDVAQVAGDDAFRFRHALIRDAAYRALPKASRAGLHARFAGWLESRDEDGSFAEIVAYHLEQAHRYAAETGGPDAGELGSRAGRKLAQAARRALARGDLPAGANLLERAVVGVPAGDALRVELEVELGNALTVGGEFARAEEVLVRARAEAAGNERLELAAEVALAGVRSWKDGTPGAAVEAAIERALPIFERLDDQLGLARAYDWLADVRNNEGALLARIECLERALEHARRAGAPAEEQAILTYLGAPIAGGPIPVPAGIRRIYANLDQPGIGAAAEMTLLASLAELVAMQGRFDEALALVDRVLAIGEEFGLTFQLARIRDHTMSVHLLRGALEAAEHELRWSTDAYQTMGEAARRSSDAELLALVLYDQGRYDEAWKYAELGKRLSAPDDVVTLAYWRQVSAKLRARRGEPDAARRLACEALEMTPEESLVSRTEALMTLAHVLELIGDPRGAAGALQDALALHEQKQNLVGAAHASAEIERLRSG
jgi:class 3 adenylate cyclase/tetratricopeptide (TPR) repeat protein